VMSCIGAKTIKGCGISCRARICILGFDAGGSHPPDSRMRNEHYSCGSDWEGYILPLSQQDPHPLVWPRFCF
jgi:hypothetical protein